MKNLKLFRELIVDNFAGGGGASTGIKLAIGRDVDVAVNHDEEAVLMHLANHPNTQHYCEDVWNVDPKAACGGQPVGLAWFSPDCKHFSKAKGTKPVSKNVRGLAWLAVKWAKAVKPRIIMLENVEEFVTWGPLGPDQRPCPKRKGQTFARWVSELKRLGYVVSWRELRACDFGAPTIRKRLFLVARCDGKPIQWPKPTHGPGLIPYRTAADCIDWSIPCPSIFDRERPLAENTMRRIARGVMKYVVNAPKPFIVPVTHSTQSNVHPIDEPMRTVTTAKGGELALVVPTLVQTGYGERAGQAPRALDIGKPLGTIVGNGKHALVAAFLAKHNGIGAKQVIGQDRARAGAHDHGDGSKGRGRSSHDVAPVRQQHRRRQRRLERAAQDRDHRRTSRPRARLPAEVLRHRSRPAAARADAHAHHQGSLRARHGRGRRLRNRRHRHAHAHPARALPGAGLPRRLHHRRRPRARLDSDQGGAGAHVRQQRVPAAVAGAGPSQLRRRDRQGDCSVSEKTAFPTPGTQHTSPQGGMSLRDYFAAKALQGLLAVGHPFKGESATELAKVSYAYADAMMTERAK
jgi:site-specific DNA-cytosine methylase